MVLEFFLLTRLTLRSGVFQGVCLLIAGAHKSNVLTTVFQHDWRSASLLNGRF
jgi:hypothetical protein